MSRHIHLLFLLSWLVALNSSRYLASEIHADSPDTSVAELAEEVIAAIDRFDTIELHASYSQVRDVNAFRSDTPLLLSGTGKLVYRADTERWYLRNDGFSFRSGVNEAVPKTTYSGYDGEVHYHGDSRRWVLAERGSRRSAQPRGMFWEPILTYDYLGRALERDSARVTFRGEQDGRRVIEMESTWGDEQQPWKLTVRFDADRSYLPLWQKLEYTGKPYAECALRDLKRVPDSDQWYPSVVATKFHQKALGIVEKEYRVEKIRIRDSFDDDEFRLQPPTGSDIVDRRTNLAWHSDPWWNEMMPWLVTDLGFPRYAFQSLNDFKSQADSSAEGMAAPPIEAAHWLGENPGRWDREGRRFSVLYFWGEASSLSSPHPQWSTELGELAKLIEPFGGEVIGIGSSDTNLESFKKTAAELKMNIPFAIDAVGDRNGKTHQAFKLNHYYSVVIVDEQEKVRLLGPEQDALLTVIGQILSEGEMDAIRSLLKVDPSMSRKEHDAIKAKWLQLRRKTVGTGRIHGIANAGGEGNVRLTPRMRLLSSSNPGGYMLFIDNRGRVSVQIDEATGQFEFNDLPRGVYQLEWIPKDGKPQETVVVLEDDDDVIRYDFSDR